MKESLCPGLKFENICVVSSEMTPPSIPAPVLATPRMIALIEHACVACIAEHLDEREISLGTHVNVSHVGAARVGEEIRVRSRLVEIHRRILTFETEVEAPSGIISTGSHQRKVVPVSVLTRGPLLRKKFISREV